MPVTRPLRALPAINRIEVTWTSDAAGAASQLIEHVEGVIVRVQFVPGTGGNQPTNAYDITLLDVGGEDVLAGQGANLSNAAPSSVCPGIPMKDAVTTSNVPVSVSSSLTLTVANAGNTKSGTVYIYMR